jgi:hypothetical protein
VAFRAAVVLEICALGLGLFNVGTFNVVITSKLGVGDGGGGVFVAMVEEP